MNERNGEAPPIRAAIRDADGGIHQVIPATVVIGLAGIA